MEVSKKLLQQISWDVNQIMDYNLVNSNYLSYFNKLKLIY